MTCDQDPIAPAVRLSTVAGTFLFVLSLAFANETFDWRVVGDHDWEAIIAVVLVGITVLAYSIPSTLRR